jgi:hypothetical protein
MSSNRVQNWYKRCHGEISGSRGTEFETTPPDPSRRTAMAKSAADGSGPDLTTHALVKAMEGTSDPPRGLVALTGYFGPDPPSEDLIRLYTSLDFLSYYEIPKDAIKATSRVNADDVNSPTVAYVASGTIVREVHARPVGYYLQGGITAEHIHAATQRARAATAATAAPPPPGLTVCNFFCPWSLWAPEPSPAAGPPLGALPLQAGPLGFTLCGTYPCTRTF